MNQRSDLDQLTATVQTLMETMTLREAQQQKRERRFKWLFSFVAVAWVLVWISGISPVSQAVAEDKGFGEGIKHLFQILGNVENILKSHPAQGKDGIASLESDLATIIHNTATLSSMAVGASNNKEFLAFVKGMMTLVMRVKQDSDVLRMMALYRTPDPTTVSLVTKVNALQKYNTSYPNTPNLSLEMTEASPSLAIHQISETVANSLNAMVYSMDSTAGRMGRSMSWVPMP